jgi:hypothetical protein
VDTEIRYLELVKGDLEDAARRETMRDRDRAHTTGRALRLAKPVTAIAAAVVVLAGAIGWFVTSDGFSSDEGGGGEEVAGSTGGSATGATGQFAADLRFDDIFAAPTPAPGDQVDVAVGTPGATISRVIRTAQLALEIPRDSFDDRFGDVADIANDLGGYVQDSTTRRRSGELTMRVPATSFGDALRDLRDLGDVEVQRIQGQDVTAEYVDLEARIRIAEARRDVLLRLMDEANSISQTIRVQNALDDTQLRIEELQGRLNLLDDRTSLATIRVELREEGVDPAPDTASLPNAFERSVSGFVGVIAAIVIGLGYLLPLALIGLIAWFVVIRVRRRRRGTV